MQNKKGSFVSMIMLIAYVAAVIMVVVMGTKIFSVLIKTKPAFIAKDYALSAEAVLAAPENAAMMATAPPPIVRKGIVGDILAPRRIEIFLGTIDFMNGKATGTNVVLKRNEVIWNAIYLTASPIAGLINIAGNVNFAKDCQQGYCELIFNTDRGVVAGGPPELSGALALLRAYCVGCWSKNYNVIASS